MNVRARLVGLVAAGWAAGCAVDSVDNSGQGVLCSDAEAQVAAMCDRWQVCGIGGYADAAACAADQLGSSGAQLSLWRADAMAAYTTCFASSCTSNITQCLDSIAPTEVHVRYETACRETLGRCGVAQTEIDARCGAGSNVGVPPRVLAADVVEAHITCLQEPGCGYDTCMATYDQSRSCRP